MKLNISVNCGAKYNAAIGEACSKIMDTDCLGTGCHPNAQRFVDRMRSFCDGRFTLNVICPDELGPFASRYCSFQSNFCAFSRPYGSTIYICPRMTQPGCNTSCIILHELTHMTGDPFETGPESCEEACFPGCRSARNPLDCPGHESCEDYVDPLCVPGNTW